MAVSFKGDFAKLKKWANKMEQVPELMPVISKNLADETISLIRDGMNRGETPYKGKYRKLVLRSGQPLKKTGGMFGSWSRQIATAGKFRVSNAKDYSGYHQHGTGIYGPRKKRITPLKKYGPISPTGKGPSAKALAIPTPGGVIFRGSVKGTPKRLMVPDKRGLPKAWKRAYRETVNEIFVSHFRSR